MPRQALPLPPPAQRHGLADLVGTRARLLTGELDRADVLARCIALAQSPACKHAFLHTDFDAARAGSAAASPKALLAGLPVSVKDLFDVAGQPTRAASRVLDQATPAAADAPAVARLRHAGGALLGRTHMVEFAYAGVGLNPHHATPLNVADPVIPRIPGGSSSGAAVSVASGACFIGLGSDTGGSIRIPAALNGIVGFKPTARTVPTAGALPLSPTLDTVCAMTRSVRDAIVAHEVLSGQAVAADARPLNGYRLAWTGQLFLDDADATVARSFERALSRLRHAGASIEEIAMPELSDMAPLQAGGGLTAVESHAWHCKWIEQHRDRYDPRVLSRILRGANLTPSDHAALLRARSAWITGMNARLAGVDAVLSPTVPVVAPSIASVLPDDTEYFRVNALLLRNTSVVNLLDGCAISLPCHSGDDLPVGLMLWHGALHDDVVLNLALAVEAALASAS